MRTTPRRARRLIATRVSLLSSYPYCSRVFGTPCARCWASRRRRGKFLPFAGLSLSLLAVPVLLAIIVPDVGFVVSLMGASLGAALILVVPSLIGRRVLSDVDRDARQGRAGGEIEQRATSSRRSACWSGCSGRP